MFLFYGLYFEFWSLSVWSVINQQYIFMFIMTYCCQLFFLATMFTIAYKEWIHLWLQFNKFFNCNTYHFIFHFSNDEFVLTIIIFWLSWIITEIKHFFVATKIFISILLSVSINNKFDFNATLLFRIPTELFSNIFCNM